MNKRISLTLALVSIMGIWAQAQNPTPTTQGATPTTGVSDATLGDVKPEEKQKDDVKDQITNPRLAAEVGSKSKWSISANIGYSGGSVETPLERIRPNYRETPGPKDLATSLSGSVGVAYRMTPRVTSRLSTGILMRTPFHNTDQEVVNNVRNDKNRTKVFQAQTPSISLSMPVRSGSWMANLSSSLSYYTNEVNRNEGYDWGAALTGTLIREFKGSGWQPGLSLSISNSFFSDDVRDSDTYTNKDARDDYGVGAYPFVEYVFSDTYQFRTLVGFEASHYRSDEAFTFKQDKVYQSMGIGIVPEKGIWIYPNVQWLPEDIRADKTNVGISATINVF